jgi:hypothetical protein
LLWIISERSFTDVGGAIKLAKVAGPTSEVLAAKAKWSPPEESAFYSPEYEF